MGNVHWLKDLPSGSIMYDDDDIMMTQETFDKIGDYTRSQPTGPSSGRIYKKNLNWAEPDDPNWVVYICEEDEQPGWVLHRGRHVIIL